MKLIATTSKMVDGITVHEETRLSLDLDFLKLSFVTLFGYQALGHLR